MMSYAEERDLAAPEDVMGRLGDAVASDLFDGTPRFPLSLIGLDGSETFVDSPSADFRPDRPVKGVYAASIHTPWGQKIQARATVNSREIQVKVCPIALYSEALPWILFESGVLKRLSAREVRPNEYPEHRLRYAFWTQDAGRWTRAERGVLVASERFYEAGGQLFGRLIVHVQTPVLRPLWFVVESAKIPAQVVALPPVFNLEILVLPDQRGGGQTRVAAMSLQRVSRNLDAFVACGDATAASSLLQRHASLPAEPAYFFFHLIRTYFGGVGGRTRQGEPLYALAPDLPDGYVAEAHKQMSAARPVLDKVRALLIDGANRGVPVWPTSLKHLDNGLAYLAKRISSDDNGMVGHARRQISPFVLAASPSSVIRFFGFKPKKPLLAPPPLSPKIPPRPTRKIRIGLVVSAKMAKTIVVMVTNRVPHRRFGKIIKISKKFYAHDESRQACEGDTVKIQETRPLSKLKRWRLVEIIGPPLANRRNGHGREAPWEDSQAA